MILSELKEALKSAKEIAFELPNGSLVARHFHVTEVGQISKRFIDCGGTLRNEEVISMQLWEADDYDHRLHPEKLLSILELSEKVLEMDDLVIEVEYQGTTIQKFGLGVKGDNFLLQTTQTDCLAKDNCGIPVEKPRVRLSELGKVSSTSCAPDSGCC